jgi:HlyD family secretion protein
LISPLPAALLPSLEERIAEMKRVGLILALLAVLFAGWSVLGREQEKKPAPAGNAPAPADPGIPVVTSVVARGEMAKTLLLTGTLRSDADVRLAPRISGRVERVLVREGDRVRPGQLLVALDPTEFQARVAKSRASLQAAKARLSQAEHGAVVKDTGATAEVERAESALAAAKLRLSQAQAQAGISDTEARTQVQTAESRVTWARRKLDLLKEGARRQERRQAELAVQQAQATLEEAKSRYERRRQLQADGAIAGEEVDAAHRQFQVAEAEYRSARERVQLLEEGARTFELQMAEEEVTQAEEGLRQAKANQARRAISQDEVNAAETQVRQARAVLEVAKAGLAQKRLTQDDIRSARAAVAQSAADLAYDEEQLRATQLVSPVSGIVVSRTVNAGETVGPAAPVLRIVAGGDVYFEGRVPERDLPLIKVGQQVATTVDSVPGQTFEGEVEEIIPVAESGSRAFRARVRVRGAGRRLPVGGFARGVATVSVRRGIVVIPKEAIRTEAGDSFVYLVQGGKARRQTVTLGLQDDRRAEVLLGLSPGQTIVTQGAASVTEGSAVEGMRG